MSVYALEPVFGVEQVLGVGVILLERFGAVQEEVHEHRVRHQLRDLPDGLVLDLETRHVPQQLQDEQQDRGARAERRGQELGRQDRGVPVRTRRETVVEERRHRVDADRHRNRQQDEGNHESLRVRTFREGAKQDVRDDDEVHQEVHVQHDHVPRQDGSREVQPAERRHHVPQAVRTADVDHDEEHAHRDRAQGQQLTDDHDLADRFPVVHVGGDHEHDGGGGDADQEREVADVEAPTHLVAHCGDAEPLAELPPVGVRARRHQSNEQEEPGPVQRRPLRDAGEASRHES